MRAPMRAEDHGAGIGALRLHRILLRFALAGAGVFSWLFIFEYFALTSGRIEAAFTQTAFLYALSQVCVSLFTPLCARLLKRGVREVLVFAALAASASFVVLGAGFEGFWSGTDISSGIVLYALALGVYRSLYWLPYELEANAVPRAARGMMGELFVALAPVFAGVFVAWSAASIVYLLFGAAILIAISAIPLAYLPDIRETYSWSWRDTYHQLFHHDHKALRYVGILDGISAAALIFFWPLALLILFQWSYGLLGLVLTLSFLVAILLRSPIRALLRRPLFAHSRAIKSALVVSPWLLRLIVASPLSVVLVDSYFYTTSPTKQQIDPLAFEQASDGNTFIDEYTALKEIAMALGRAGLAILAGLIALSVSIPAALTACFLLAAVASILAFWYR